MRLEIRPLHAYSSEEAIWLHLTRNEYIYLESSPDHRNFRSFTIELVSPRRARIHLKPASRAGWPALYEQLRAHFDIYIPWAAKRFMLEEKIKAGTKEYGWDFRQWNWRKSVAAQQRHARRKAQLKVVK